jgi:hypothetical protein
MIPASVLPRLGELATTGDPDDIATRWQRIRTLTEGDVCPAWGAAGGDDAGEWLWEGSGWTHECTPGGLLHDAVSADDNDKSGEKMPLEGR